MGRGEKRSGAATPQGIVVNNLFKSDPGEHRRRSTFYQDHEQTCNFIRNTVRGTIVSAVEKSDVDPDIIFDMVALGVREARHEVKP